jgi:hypothetical protein
MWWLRFNKTFGTRILRNANNARITDWKGMVKNKLIRLEGWEDSDLHYRKESTVTNFNTCGNTRARVSSLRKGLEKYVESQFVMVQRSKKFGLKFLEAGPSLAIKSQK